MPYIPRPRRIQLAPLIAEMVEQEVRADGDLNYVLFYYAKYHIPKSYNSFKNYLGELQRCHDEIKRKLLDIYEDRKEIENGTV